MKAAPKQASSKATFHYRPSLTHIECIVSHLLCRQNFMLCIQGELSVFDASQSSDTPVARPCCPSQQHNSSSLMDAQHCQEKSTEVSPHCPANRWTDLSYTNAILLTLTGGSHPPGRQKKSSVTLGLVSKDQKLPHK